jgi:hypothetical protein
MGLCRRKAWCDHKAQEASSAGYIAVDFKEASVGRYIPCGRRRWTLKGEAVVVGWGPHSADQECASEFFPLSTLLGFFLPVALLFACSLLVVACVLLIAPFYGRSLVTYHFLMNVFLADEGCLMQSSQLHFAHEW